MSDSPEAEDIGGGNSIPLLTDTATTESFEVDDDGDDVESQVVNEAKSDQSAEPQQIPQITSSASVGTEEEINSTQLECPICLQACVHPVELPCRHIFCFLCIKGVAMQGHNGRCAICRSNIPHNVLTHPRLKDISQLYKNVKSTSGYEWYYEARGGGWWQYDERSMQELEKAFESGQSSCQLLIAGHLYEMDFPQMIQYRLNNRTLFRRIKRDVPSAEKRGIAGIRLNQGRGGGGGNSGNADSSSSTDNNRRGRSGGPPQQSQSISPTQRSGSRSQNDSSSQSHPPSRASNGSGSGSGSGHLRVLSEPESDDDENQNETADSDEPDYLEDEEDDMELGEEEELGESVDEEPSSEEDLRDGARAPTRRSDRSNSSTNQTPPPNGITNGSSVIRLYAYVFPLSTQLDTLVASCFGIMVDKNTQFPCSVSFDIPPKDIKYGSLEEKSAADAQNKDPFTPKKKPSQSFPKNPPPKGVQFPFLERSESAERIVHTESHVREGAGNIMGKIKVGHQRVVFPGWLIEMDDGKLGSIMNIKNVLQSGKKICDLIDPLFEAVEELGVNIKKEEVIEVVRRMPEGDEGLSFSAFLLAMGSPELARKNGILQDPAPYSEEECQAKPDGDNAQAEGNSESKAPAKRSRAETLDRLYQPHKYEKPDIWPKTDQEKTKSKDQKTEPKEKPKNKKNEQPQEKKGGKQTNNNKGGKVDITGYSLREKVFFSGLLIFEMYHTIRAVEDLYFQSDNIPQPKEKLMKNQMSRGFGSENIGTRKLGFAEWDRPLPPLPKMSPYVADLPFVATRWKITKPNEVERTKRRTLTSLQPLHLMINAPPRPRAPIKVTENQMRIKKAMEYLASKGNCVAMLPNAHCIVHLSDTFLQKLEEINMHAMEGPTPKKLKPNNDLAYIYHEAKNLFLLHGLPPQIAKMDFTVKFTDAICLRKICEHVRSQHWNFICSRKVLFRNKAWRLMHVERIPCGPLRQNFVYAFNTYLPYVSHLPIVHDIV